MSVLSILKQIKVSTKILIPILIVLGFLAKNVKLTSNEFGGSVEKLPYCDEQLIQNRAAVSKRNIYVTTLDGRLTTIDITRGSEEWSVSTEPGELLSSSIHELELTTNGKWVRMIPTLNGGIYKFDGESLEPIPVTADDLLKSSFKFAENQVISGGKEVRTYGINGRTGNTVYECSMSGCKKPNRSNVLSETVDGEKELDFDSDLDDMIVINRHTQTIRAIDPREGNERWNFSIGHHELKLESNANCKSQYGADSKLDKDILDVDLRVIIPEGIVCGYSKANPNTILWKHKLEAPIVSIHRMNLESYELYSVDLFQAAHWLWQGSRSKVFPEVDSKVSPSVYLGMYQKQLYIQEADGPVGSIDHEHSHLEENLLSDDSNFYKIPFKPYPASNTEILYLLEGKKSEEKTELMQYENGVIANAILNQSPYAEGQGYFIFKKPGFNHTMQCAKKTRSTHVNPEDFDNVTFQNHGVIARTSSLFDYWKEILVIALTTAFVINVMLSNSRKTQENGVVYVAVPMGKEAIEFEEEEQQKKQIIENEIKEAQAKIRSASESQEIVKETPYVSRFLTDFDLVQCLGKGGFGVVFEVANKLDNCRYAVKRILLPTKAESRERVMREVRTLANCEHKNIVRYFHSWMETPPKGWQEQRDKEILNRDIFSTSITIDSPSPTEESKAFVIHDEKKNVDRSLDSGAPWIMNIQKQYSSNLSSTCNFGNGLNVDDSDSFIQFKADTNDATETANGENDETDEDDESFQIEFKNDTRTSVSEAVSEKSHVISMRDSSSSKPPVTKGHRRQMSLDLPSASGPMPKKINTSLPSGSTKMYLYIQMQLCMKSSLKDWLRNTDLQKRNGKTFEIWSQIIEAVHYVHLKGLIHRDLKPGNIFFALDGQIKIGDFGLVTDMNEIPIDPLTSSSNSNSSSNMEFDFSSKSHKKHTQRVGTSLYMSPEQAKGLSYNYKVDIYSLGLILFELLNYFNTETERFIVLESIRKHNFPKEFIENYKNEYELLKLMLSKKPEERPTTFGVFSRPPLNRPDDYLEWHFELPTRRRESHSSHNSLSK